MSFVNNSSSSEQDSSAEESDENISKDSGDDVEDGGSEEDAPLNKDLSIQELLELREKLGTKRFDEKFNKKQKKGNAKKKFVRENKNRPQEMSSKIRPRKSRPNMGTGPPATKVNTRDPRFDNLCGSEYNDEVFDKRYSFLSSVREREKMAVEKSLRKAKNPEKKKQMKYLLNRMNNQEKEKARKIEEREVLSKWNHEEKMKVKQGKKPFFLKASEKRKLIKEHRIKKLEESGKLEKANEKKKKRLQQKQRKHLQERRET